MGKVSSFERRIMTVGMILLLVSVFTALSPRKSITGFTTGETKEVNIGLDYGLGPDYDADNDGVEVIDGIVDLSVKESTFNINYSEDKLCTKWGIYPLDSEEATIICYGSIDCCNFLGLEPYQADWDADLLLTYGRHGASVDNIVSAQVVYADYDLAAPYSNIYYSDVSELSVQFGVESEEELTITAFPGLGSGTPGDPYQITDCTELQAMNESLSSHYILMNDIDCSDTVNWAGGSGFSPIGYTSNAFTGSLDGKNHTISDLYVNRPSLVHAGLIGLADSPKIFMSNIGLENVNISGKTYVGGLCGYCYANISDSYSTGTVRSNYFGGGTGGLIGKQEGGFINHSYSECDIYADYYAVGGLAGGLTSSSVIMNSYAIGNVDGGNNYVGGLVGDVASSSDVINSYSTGNVTSNSGSIGGLIGRNAATGIISNSYWNNHTGNPSDCVGDDSGTTTCTSVDDNEPYFFNVSDAPMDVWEFPPWDDFCNTSGYPSLEWENLGDINGCAGYIPPPLCPASMSGSNTTSDPCLITTCIQLQAMNESVSGHYALANDVDCSDTVNWAGGSGFSPVGDNSNKFNGTFDGRNNTITGLYVNRPSTDYVGLFGYTYEAVINNVGLEEVNMTGKGWSGSLIGATDGSGGFTGFTFISNAYATGRIRTVQWIVGGLVGNCHYCKINNTYANVSVNGGTGYAGGLVAQSDNSNNIIENSYAIGDVNGSTYIGGLIGKSTAGIMKYLYSTGNVNGTSNVGGFIGDYIGSGRTGLYWNNHSGNPGFAEGTDPGATGYTAVQDNESYFFDVNNAPMTSWSYPPWDDFCNTSGYPSLEWENLGDVSECLGYTAPPPPICNYYIDSCKTTGWESEKTYCLNKSINTTARCMHINQDNVTLDCKGHTLTGDRNSWPWETGVDINNSVNVTVRNCNIYNFTWGVTIWYSNNSRLENNTASFNRYDGFHFDDANYNTLVNNTATNNSESGFDLSPYDSKGNVLVDNAASNNSYNLQSNCWGSTCKKNYIDTSNTVNGRPIYYLWGVENGTYGRSDNVGIFHCFNCTNITLEELNISENYAGIHFWETKNSTIINSELNNNIYGIDLDKSVQINITGNSFNSNTGGINIEDGSYIYIINNSVNNSVSSGIELDGSLYLDIINNKLLNNGNYGMWLDEDNEFFNIIGNDIRDSGSDGIRIEDRSKHNIIKDNVLINNDDGLEFGWNADNNTVINNTIMNNTDYGIYIHINSKNNTLINNTIEYSDWSGIYITADSTNNTFINTRSCFNNQSGGAYYDINDLDSNTFNSSTCDTSSGTTCHAPCVPFCPASMSGSNTTSDPCLITNCTQLQAMNESLGNHYALNNSINCSDTVNWNSGKGFDPVGDNTNKFAGTLDGRNNTITDLYINRTSETEVGLFGWTNGANINNVGLINVNITGSTSTAGLVGYAAGVSNIENSYSAGNVISAGNWVAGLVGQLLSSADVINSYSTANVTCNIGCGGLVGSHSGDLINSYATGNVVCSGFEAGGLVGSIFSGNINNSFATGNVSAPTVFGGLIGGNTGGVITNSYWYNRSQGLDCYNGGNTNCTAIDNEQYFFDINNEPLINWSYPPWDDFCNTSGYPSLEWQNITNVTVCAGYTPPLACGDIITEDSVLKENLTYSGSVACLTIGADDVTLDCQGHAIEFIGTPGSRNYGINNSGYDRVTVKNCRIYNSRRGVSYENSENSFVINNTLIGNYLGVYAYPCTNNTFVDNHVEHSSSAGFYLESGSNNNISFNIGKYNDYGVEFTEIHNSFFDNNDLSYNNDSTWSGGLVCDWYCDNNTFRNNILNNNKGYGWDCASDCSNNIFINNTANNNGWDGFVCDWYCPNITLINNTANNNSNLCSNCAGFTCWSSCGNSSFYGNTFNYNNNNSGVYVYDAGDSLFINNSFNNNEVYGLYVEESQNVTITNNSVSDNRDQGVCFWSAGNSTVSDNYIINNTKCGLNFTDSNDNLIYNNFINNTINVEDNGNNAWNITKTPGTNIIGGPYLGGNFWSDYAGYDTNGDGIGDEFLPYNGTASIHNGGDWLPLVSPRYYPNATEFSVTYGSTNFSEVPDLESVAGMALATQYGKLQFPSAYSINASGQDYDTYIEIGDNFISVNASALDETFNSSANITINNVVCPTTIYYGSGTYTEAQQIISENNICNETTDPSCKNITCIGSTVTFNASHFTGFASFGGAYLTIWDDRDAEGGSLVVRTGETANFYANYSNGTSPIYNADCIIFFNDSNASMTFDIISDLYEYSRSFTPRGTYNWNVTCNETAYPQLTATDTIIIANALPTHDDPLLTSTYGTNLYTENLTVTSRNTNDIDGDWVTNAINWRKDTNSILALNLPFDGYYNSTHTKDYSENSNHGKINGAAWNRTKGHNGKGVFTFDTTNNITVSDSSSLDLTNKVTIELWVNDSGAEGTPKKRKLLETFESGLLSDDWTTYSSTAYGRFNRTSSYANSGTYSLVLDINQTGPLNLNEMKTNYDFAGSEQIILDFWHYNIADENHNGTDHTGQQNADAYYYTCDGNYWYILGNLTSTAGWDRVYVNITDDPDFCSEVNSSFAVKITQYDNGPYDLGADGRAFDGINVTFIRNERVIAGKDVDAYELNLDNNMYVGGFVNSRAVKAKITNNLHHIALTYNGTHQMLYADGQLADNITASGAISTNAKNILIGEEINGTIDDVRVWNIALTPAQVNALYLDKIDTIVSQQTSIGDIWQACMTPNDGYEDGTTKCSNSITVSDIAAAHYCGDGTCQSDETCNTCPQDCGTCGGGGTLPPPPCIPAATKCTPWGACIAGSQSRSCSNGCATWSETQTCFIDLCAGVFCADSTRDCDDGTVTTCSNTCDPGTGLCSTCEPPQCVEIEYIQPSPDERDVKRPVYSIPCVDVTYTESQEPVKMSVGTSIDPKLIPRGYEVVVDPFNLDCTGESLDITLSIPENFVDVQALKCVGGVCTPTKVTTVTALRCGSEIVRELERKTEVLAPEAMEINITEIEADIETIKEGIKSGDTSIAFKGELLEDLKAKLSMPEKPVKEAANPSLQISGTPIVLTLENAKEGISTNVTIPYVPSNKFEPGSIAMYVKTEEDWEYLGGDINKEASTISASVENIAEYLDENSQAVFAAMGILCVNCLNTSFDLVYEPKQGSRDAILLIHGLASSPKIYNDVVNDIRLTNQPFKTYLFGYPSSKSVDENAEELISYLALRSTEFDNLYIVGHSLGGLIAQQVLHESYQANQRQPGRYPYVDKVRKVILLGVPNEGTPIIKTYENLFKSLVNEETGPKMFNVNARIIDDLVEGRVTPRMPGVDYYVVAGTKAYEFNALLIPPQYGKTDGIVPVKSAQNIGGDYISDQCNNYWELSVSHTSLVNNEVSRKLIEKIIAREIIGAQDVVKLGSQKFFDLHVERCGPADTYVLVGKRVSIEEVEDLTGCSCGNGVCGIGEDEINCPSDCAVFGSPKRIVTRFLLPLLVVMLIAVLTTRYVLVTKPKPAEIKKEEIKKKEYAVPKEVEEVKQVKKYGLFGSVELPTDIKRPQIARTEMLRERLSSLRESITDTELKEEEEAKPVLKPKARPSKTLKRYADLDKQLSEIDSVLGRLKYRRPSETRTISAEAIDSELRKKQIIQTKTKERTPIKSRAKGKSSLKLARDMEKVQERMENIAPSMKQEDHFLDEQLDFIEKEIKKLESKAKPKEHER